MNGTSKSRCMNWILSLTGSQNLCQTITCPLYLNYLFLDDLKFIVRAETGAFLFLEAMNTCNFGFFFRLRGKFIAQVEIPATIKQGPADQIFSRYFRVDDSDVTRVWLTSVNLTSPGFDWHLSSPEEGNFARETSDWLTDHQQTVQRKTEPEFCVSGVNFVVKKEKKGTKSAPDNFTQQESRSTGVWRPKYAFSTGWYFLMGKLRPGDKTVR